MKSLLLALFAALLLIAPGCSTTKPITPASWQQIARLAAFDGATIYLEKHPQARNVAGFKAAKVALDLVIADGQFSAEQLHAALAKLPVKELNGSTGVLLVDSATILFISLTGGESVINQKPVVQAFATGIRDGLAAAIEPFDY